MNSKHAALSTVLALMLVGCSSDQPPPATSPSSSTEAPTLSPTTTPSPTPAAAVTTAPTLVATGPCTEVASDAFVIVSGRANIFGAGHELPPAPGEGGGGVLPPQVEVEITGGAEVTFPCTSGRVDCCVGSSNSSPAGPEGAHGWNTNIDSHDGISGIIHTGTGVFLAGVFIGDDEPADPAPERLDFSETCPLECTFETLEPELGQVFYIGPGGDQPVYVAPEGATRLFLGVPDALVVTGPPGWYGNNSGQFEVAVEVR